MIDSSSAGSHRLRAKLRRWLARCVIAINRNSSFVIGSAILIATAIGLLIVCAPPPVRYLRPQAPASKDSAGPVPVQHTREAGLATGKLLVADDRLSDSNFAESVVLLLRYDQSGAMGVIINRALTVKLSEVLPKMPGLENRTDIMYSGGPVGRAEILMLVRTKEKPEDSSPVFGDVYLSDSAELLRQLASAPKSAPFRVYSGYAGWAPRQLEAEVDQGAWHIFPATADTVFAKMPEDLWRQFINRATIRLAGSFVPATAAY